MEDRVRKELNAALDSAYKPAPWLLATSVGAVRRNRKTGRHLGWLAGALTLIMAVSTIALFMSLRGPLEGGRSARTSLPQPTPQAVTRTSPGAQIAWVTILSESQGHLLVGLDAYGRVVGHLDSSVDPSLSQVDVIWRSADGSILYGLAPQEIFAFSAMNGSVQRTYSRLGGNVVGDSFSRDGRWLAILMFDAGLKLEVLNLSTGQWQVVEVSHDPNAALPGMRCIPNPTCLRNVVWGLVFFSHDSTHLYTLTDWGGPARLTAFVLRSGGLVATGSSIGGQQGREFLSCAGPAMAAEVGAGDETLIAFCHFDGAIWFFDLRTLSASGVVASSQSSPFWLSPIFTPDGQLMYLQSPEPGSSMQVVDLANHRRLGPILVPSSLDQPGPLGWLFPTVYAGKVASTMPVSPDGLRLYAATEDGVVVLRIPDLKPLRKLWPGFKAGEVWISGDGNTIFATSDDGKQLAVSDADGRSVAFVTLPTVTGFVASEHA